MNTILNGADIFCLRAASYKNIRFGLVTNNAATCLDGSPSRLALLQAGINIVVLFSPEHGLSARGEDGAYQHHHTDTITQLPVVSLYSDHLMPSASEMAGIDCLLFDIPDVGCRFYTYLWTMTYAMEACASNQKPFIVLDRPNPGGAMPEHAEGPMLDETNCASFIGRWNIPVRHCCTLGELAKYFAATRIKSIGLQVIKVEHWNRNQAVAEAGWLFVATSPAITDPETVLLYPGMGLLEGINVNEGRGTAQAFKKMGAPWLDAQQINQAFNDLQLPGIQSKAIDYVPEWGLYAGERCYGLQFAITDSKSFRPVSAGLALLQLVVSMHPADCKERLYPTVANPSGTGHLDKLTGVYHAFWKLKNGQALSASLLPKEWATLIQPYLLYY